MAATMPRQIRTMTIKLSRPSLIALAVSMSALSSGFTFAAEEMDHSTMDHGSMPMDHSKMNHGAAQVQMGGMDQQQALLQQVMSMTPEQMAMLPPDQRQQVEMLRQLASQQMM